MAKAKPKWKPISVERDGEILTVYLHPPGTFRNPNHWAWSCAKLKVHGRSLKVETFSAAKERVIAWFKGEPARKEWEKQETSVLTWEDWDAIQVEHVRLRSSDDSDLKRRAERTLQECRNAQRLFVAITKAESATSVDPDTVARFQRECAKRESKYGKPYGATTIRKTISHMSASFNRCCPASGKRRCVRGVVPVEKLLATNPFEAVQWVQVENRQPRHFTASELQSLFTWKFFGACPLASLFARFSLWSCGRLEEMTMLRWDWFDSDGYIKIPDSVAKWGKGKTVRIPPALLEEIQAYRIENPFVWAGYVDQLREYHRVLGHHGSVHKIQGFAPQRFRGVCQKWIGEWAIESKVEGLSHHAFRRTGLQWSREEQIRKAEAEYAEAANVNKGVADKSYTRRPERDWADVSYRNIASELRKHARLAYLMGLREDEQESVSLASIQEALNRGDLDTAKRLLAARIVSVP